MKPKLLLCLALVLSGCSTSRGIETVPPGYPWISFNGKQLLFRNQLWDVKSGRQIRQFAVPPQITISNGVAHGYGYVEAVAFSPDGKKVLTATAHLLGPEMVGPGPVQLWDIASGRKLLEFDSDKRIENAQFLPDGKRILMMSEDGNFPIQIWDAKTGQRLLALRDRPVSIFSGALADFSPDGRLIAAQGQAGIEGHYYGTVNIWDSISGPKICTITGSTNSFFASARFSPDGKSILTGEMTDRQPKTMIWDVKTGHRIREFFEVHPVTFTPDGRKVICSGTNGLALFYLKSNRETQHFTTPESFPAPDSGAWMPEKIMLSPDGKRLIVQYSASTSTAAQILVALWNAETGKLIKHFGRENQMVWETMVGFSPKGENLMLFNNNGKPELFDGRTGERLQVLENFQLP